MHLKISFSLITIGLLLVIFSMFNILDLKTFLAIENYFEITVKQQIFRIQDYGLTFMVIGIMYYKLMKNGWARFKTPSTTKKTMILGFIALFFTTFGLLGYMLFSILRSSGYQSFVGDLKNSIDDIPMTFFPFIIWFIANIGGITNDFRAEGFIKDLKFKSYNLWYWFILSLTLLLLVGFIYIGNPWLTLIAILWSYLYISIMIGRQNARIHKENNIC